MINEVLLSLSDENDDPSTACLHAQDTREKENKVMFDGPCKTFFFPSTRMWDIFVSRLDFSRPRAPAYIPIAP